MIFNRWFWFSVMASIFAQTIQWRPAMAEELFPEPKHADWICYHADSSIRTYGRMPAIVDEPKLSPEFVAWAKTFGRRLDETLNKKTKL